jgi:hypothetical protein
VTRTILLLLTISPLICGCRGNDRDAPEKIKPDTVPDTNSSNLPVEEKQDLSVEEQFAQANALFEQGCKHGQEWAKAGHLTHDENRRRAIEKLYRARDILEKLIGEHPGRSDVEEKLQQVEHLLQFLVHSGP